MKKIIKKIYNNFNVKSYGITLFTVIAVALFLSYIVSTNFCNKKASIALNQDIEYLKKECAIYDENSNEESAKSLIRIVDKTKIIRDFANVDIFDKEQISEYLLNDRLTGIIVSDDETDELYYVCFDEINLDFWKMQIEAHKDISGNTSKNYSQRERFLQVYYDFAIVSRKDKNGLIICYVLQKEHYVTESHFSIEALLKGYKNSEGIYAIQYKGILLGYNIEGERANSIANTVVDAMEEEKKGKLTKVNIASERYLGMIGKCKDYYIYALYPTSKLYTNRTLILSYTLVICMVLVLISLLLYKIISIYREKELKKITCEYNRQLEESAKTAIDANNAKTAFLRRMSHDLRTPINGIMGMIDMSEYYSSDCNKQKECLRKIKNASQYLLELSNNVLDMAKFEKNDVVWREEPFDLDELFDDINSLLCYQVAESNITFSVSKKIYHKKLIGNTSALKRISINIINNAIKYNKKNGSVDISLTEIDSNNNEAVFRFICADTGIGMSEEFQKVMFEPFSQEENTNCSGQLGTGLGLTIVRRFVEKMNGNILVESKKDVGTKYTITVNIKLDKNEKVLDRDLKEEVSFENINILLVEDNELNLEIAKFLLSQTKANILEARNGKEAIDIFENSKDGEIDVILMDIFMPVVDGIEATKAIRNMKKENSKSIPIIAMSANTFAEDVERALSAGMNDMLQKPINTNQLFATIQKFLKKKGD